MPRAYAYLSAPTGPGSSDTDTASRWTHPQLSAGVYEDIPRRREDFPNVRLWYKQDWSAAKNSRIKDFGQPVQRGGTRAAQGENVRYDYIQDAHGNTVDGHRAAHIRERFRDFCVYLHNRPGGAPDTWARGTELQYCDNDWKIHDLAKTEYPQWKASYDRRVKRRATKNQSSKRPHQGPDAVHDAKLEQHDSLANSLAPTAANGPHQLIEAPYTIPSSQHTDSAIPSGSSSTTKRPLDELDSTPDILSKRLCQSPHEPRPCTSQSQAHETLSQIEAIPSGDTPSTRVPGEDRHRALGLNAQPQELQPTDLIPTTTIKSSEPSANKDLRETSSVQEQASTPLNGTSKAVDRSRKASGKMAAVWPPAPGAESLKDRCARVWAQLPDNLTKTQEDFNAWYKQAAHYKKKKLANQAVAHALPAEAPLANDVAAKLGE
ncbi:hypothetical protein BN946_scf184571.g2 [Trametes cinnabarina]|uniref:Uncharacterized protein n=1 Tax=Pycnoporus cinnabarinus TaxID=5643 RepID=A0A060T143_PYCCI|nr:hypothetical protein BN946_scf184571.g2 [Trametes cinnabarina]